MRRKKKKKGQSDDRSFDFLARFGREGSEKRGKRAREKEMSLYWRKYSSGDVPVLSTTMLAHIPEEGAPSDPAMIIGHSYHSLRE